jgi:hypothetical protein
MQMLPSLRHPRARGPSTRCARSGHSTRWMARRRRAAGESNGAEERISKWRSRHVPLSVNQPILFGDLLAYLTPPHPFVPASTKQFVSYLVSYGTGHNAGLFSPSNPGADVRFWARVWAVGRKPTRLWLSILEGGRLMCRILPFCNTVCPCVSPSKWTVIRLGVIRD